MACSEKYLEDQPLLVKGLTQGLKMLWDVDGSNCPCHNGLDQLLKMARKQVEQGLVDMDNVQQDTFGEKGFKDPWELLAWLEENRPKEDLVRYVGAACRITSGEIMAEGRMRVFIRSVSLRSWG